MDKVKEEMHISSLESWMDGSKKNYLEAYIKPPDSTWRINALIL